MNPNLNIVAMPLYEMVIEATAMYFSTTSETLKTCKSKKLMLAYKKHMCYYLIKKNDELISCQFISSLFGIRKSSVEYGQRSIENQASFRRTSGDIKDIQNLIDRFKNLKQETLLNNLCHTQQNNIQP